MAVYQTYIHTMNSHIRSRFARRDNPFVFKSVSVYFVVYAHAKGLLHRHISHVPQTRGWEKKIAEGPPCVVLASPGFMQVGPSRELFELWAPDSRNGLIITGYSIEGTLARVSAKRFVFGGGYLQFVHNALQWTVFSSQRDALEFLLSKLFISSKLRTLVMINCELISCS